MNFLLADLSFASVGCYNQFPSWNGIQRLEDTKEIIRSRKFKDKQYNSQSDKQ
jgi:hypothetical protein